MSSLRDIIPSRKGSRPCSEQIRKNFSLPHRLVTWWLTSGLLPPGDAREGSFSVFSRGGQPHALYIIVLWDPNLDVAHNLTNLKGLNLRLLRIWNKFKVIEGQMLLKATTLFYSPESVICDYRDKADSLRIVDKVLASLPKFAQYFLKTKYLSCPTCLHVHRSQNTATFATGLLCRPIRRL